MWTKALPRHSLKTRILFATTAVFIAVLWSLSFYASRRLHADMQNLLGAQQQSTITYIAAQVDKELRDRIKGLELIAAAIEPSLVDNPESLQRFIEQRHVLHSLFNAGVFATDRDGAAIADVPKATGRTGINYLDRDYMNRALREGKATVSRPLIGKHAKAAAIVIAVPIRTADGRIVGALSGVTRLDQPNFLDPITEGRYGRTGGYLLIEQKERLVITASDKSRILALEPPRGTNPPLDRHVDGYGETSILINPSGVEVLTSSQSIPTAGWIAVASLPTSEAFEPIDTMRRQLFFVTLGLTLLAAALSWWMLRRLLRPLDSAARALTVMRVSDQEIEPLPVGRADEIGLLVAAFNALLAVLNKREAALQESEERFKALHDGSFGGIAINDKGVILDCNKSLEDMTGYSRDELIGVNALFIVTPEWREQVMQNIRNSYDQPYDVEGLRKDGSTYPMTVRGKNIPYKGRTVRVTEFRDITEQRLAEQQQRIAAIAFESQEGMFITDAQHRIVRANQAFVRITGYPVDEAIGQNPHILGSGRHPPEFFADLLHGLERDGVWQGEIWNRRKDGEEYPSWVTITGVRDSSSTITHYVASLDDITLRKRAEEEIKHLAFFDQLTGLPNRRLLADRLKQALTASCRHQHCGALLFIDLDNFKTLNDTLGHDKGDLLLQQVTQRLTGCVREGDTVARLGGDEFIVLLETLSANLQEAASQTEMIGEKIITQLNHPYRFSGYEHHSSASIGITMFNGCEEVAEELLKRADMAMYQAKAAGRDTLSFFDPEMQAIVSARATMEAGLRDAIQQQHFVIHLLAQVVAQHRVIGAEALLRWHDPVNGLVPPLAFIPLAEESGLILPIGQWVLETVCERLALWARQPELAHLSIAVNISARQFRQKDFIEQVLNAVTRSGARPQQLKLELTESMLVHDIEDVIAKMVTLKAAGIGFSLDDFGTGYSSLAYLKRLPLDQLKIDQGFIRDILIDPDDAAIAKMIISLGDSLGLNVIAEGVETEAQRQTLSGQGCHAYQGYLFSRPLPLENFETYVRQR